MVQVSRNFEIESPRYIRNRLCPVRSRDHYTTLVYHEGGLNPNEREGVQGQFDESAEHSFQFSNWPEVTPQIDNGAALKALDFIESKFFVTPKRLSLKIRDAVLRDKGDHKHHCSAVDGDPAIVLTPVYVCSSRLLTEDVNVGKEICSFKPSEEFNGMVACIGMAFGSSSLSLVTHHGTLRFTSIGVAPSCEDTGPNTWRNHGLSQDAKVPVYDASHFFEENWFSFDLVLPSTR